MRMSVVRSALCDAPYDVIVLIQTSFSKDIMSSEVFDSYDWLVIRCDRSHPGDPRKGDGVLIAVRKTFISSEISVENVAKIEQSWVRIQLTDYAVHLGAVYLPPGSDVSMYEQVISSTRQVMRVLS